MIERVIAYKASDGKTFDNIEAVQQHELASLFTDSDFGGAPVVGQVASKIVKHKDRILDILTTGPRSKPKARAINGGRKSRKSSAERVNAALQDTKP